MKDGDLVCSDSGACRASHPGAFYGGQSHHVGRHFDLTVDGRPTRILVSGQEYGHLPAGVTRLARSVTILESAKKRRFFAEENLLARNPHMRGTTSLLRVLLGSGLGGDYEGEHVKLGKERVHLFECFALANFLLCSAIDEESEVGKPRTGGSRGRSTPTMRHNCAAHYRAAIQILEPTIIVLQGLGIRTWMERIIDNKSRASDVFPVEDVQIGRVRMVLVTFCHPAVPSRDNWGMNHQQRYLVETVAPTLTAALRRLA